MKQILLVFTAILLAVIATAQGQENYDIAKIPADLKTNATAVVRNEERVFTVRSTSNAKLSYKTAITIFNKNSEHLAEMSEYYDKMSTIYNLKATMYDASGQKIKSYKSSDFKDESLTSSGTLYDDSRRKKLDFLNASYPYTVEYSYDQDFNGYLSYSSWYPVQAYNLAVEKSSFTLEMPQNTHFRYLKGKGLKTDSTVLNNKITYKWSCSNFPAIEYEPYSTGVSTITPWVQATPDEFEYDHSKGSVATWKNMGAWTYQLSSDTQVLPENLKTVVKTLIANAKTDREKINILYKYLQSNTRYVSIQLGIGGFKPMAAERVAVVNYGDCKALSNYMKALLEVAGIKSNLVVLGHDMPSMNPDYSSFNQANHMILCVPTQKDTTWLECTSQYIPMGFLGSGTSAKLVLLVTEDGGKLVSTPVYKPEDNFQNRYAKVLLSPEGSAEISINTDYGSCQYEDNLGMTLMEPTDQRKKLLNNLGIPNMEIISASFKQPDKDVPRIEERIALKGSELMSSGGDKLFLTLNMLNRKESVPRKVENRQTPFSLPYGFKDTDEITYVLPKGYKAEFVPKDIVLESEFGKYTANAVLKDNTIIYTRTQQINSKKYPPAKYNDLVDFYKKIYLADKQKAVLAKIN